MNKFKQLGTASTWCKNNLPHFTEDDYRQILKECGASERGGRISAKTMTLEEQNVALARMRALGFPASKPKPAPTNWRKPRIDKLYAMWCELHEAGEVRNKSMTAMYSFLEKQLKINTMHWCTSNQLNQAVEILKQWQQRVRRKNG